MKKSLKSYASAAALALTLATPASADIFLQFPKADGLEGDSQDATFKGSIDVLAWSWGLSNSGNLHIGGGGGVGKANFQDISLTKYLDNASAGLYLRVGKGDVIENAILSVTRILGGKQIVTTKMELEDILVTSASIGGSALNEGPLTENITLNFAKFTLTNTTIDEQGNENTPTTFCYDIAENKPC